MPELPEVETVVRDLRPLLVGRRLITVEVGREKLRSPWKPVWQETLRGREVRAVDRRGKWILIELDGGPFLVVHLGMTGQLTVAAGAEPRRDHTHLVFGLERGSPGGDPAELRFRDVRRFGSGRVFADRAALDAFFETSGLGPEPFALTPRYWRDQLAGARRCLKAILLDQQVVAGVGNIYADESLFEAKLHPTRLGKDLTPAEVGRLAAAVKKVLTRAIERRGSTIRNYIGGSGLEGGYQREFRVYGRFEQPCPRCQSLIGRSRLAGRSSHFCPTCQPPPDGAAG